MAGRLPWGSPRGGSSPSGECRACHSYLASTAVREVSMMVRSRGTPMIWVPWKARPWGFCTSPEALVRSTPSTPSTGSSSHRWVAGFATGMRCAKVWMGSPTFSDKRMCPFQRLNEPGRIWQGVGSTPCRGSRSRRRRSTRSGSSPFGAPKETRRWASTRKSETSSWPIVRAPALATPMRGCRQSTAIG